jgi:hypothetical protein
MLRSLLIPAVMLASALLLGCGERPAPSEPGLTPPSFRTADNPDGPGALVVHLREHGAGFANCDVEADVCYFLGFSVAELAQVCAEGLEPSGKGLRIEHLRPDGSLHVLDRAKDEPLLVWDAPADFCADQPIAIGTGQFTGRDTDFFFSGNRTDSFGFRVQGTVSALADGQRYRLTNTLHATALRDGEVKVDNYEFTFTPIGG